MKRETIREIAVIVIAGILIASAIILLRGNRTEELYPTITRVIKIDTENDVVTTRDHTGNLWEFTGVEDWQTDDFCACIMNDKGTAEIYDDEIVSVRFAGYHGYVIHYADNKINDVVTKYCVE